MACLLRRDGRPLVTGRRMRVAATVAAAAAAGIEVAHATGAPAASSLGQGLVFEAVAPPPTVRTPPSARVVPRESTAEDLPMTFELPGAYALVRKDGTRTRATALTGPNVPRVNRDLFKTCKELKLAPAIDRITTILPGRPFQVDGLCFGDRLGAITLSGGPGAGGRVSFTKWSDVRIEGVLERVSGVVDGSVELQVVTSEGVRSAPRIARFRAERESVRVSPQRWAPYGQQRWATSDLPFAPEPNLWPDIQWDRQPPELPGSFRVRLAAGCKLQSVGIDSNGVEFLSEIALQVGPGGDEASFTVGMRPVHFLRIGGKDGGLARAARHMYRGHYTIDAEASCPVGVVP